MFVSLWLPSTVLLTFLPSPAFSTCRHKNAHGCLPGLSGPWWIGHVESSTQPAPSWALSKAGVCLLRANGKAQWSLQESSNRKRTGRVGDKLQSSRQVMCWHQTFKGFLLSSEFRILEKPQVHPSVVNPSTKTRQTGEREWGEKSLQRWRRSQAAEPGCPQFQSSDHISLYLVVPDLSSCLFLPRWSLPSRTVHGCQWTRLSPLPSSQGWVATIVNHF